MKTKRIIIAALLVALVGGGWFVYRNMFAWARIQAEKVASETLGVDVTIGNIDASFKNRTVRITGIRIDNPKGFSAGPAVKFGLVEVQADTLSREKIVIKKVLVSDNDINLEMKGTRSNLHALQSGIKKGGKPTKSEASSKAPTLNINDLVIDNTKIDFKSDLVKNNGKVTMASIRLKNVGQDNNQASAVVSQITHAVLKAALEAAARSGVLQNLSKVGTEALEEGLKSGTGELKKSLGKIKFK